MKKNIIVTAVFSAILLVLTETACSFATQKAYSNNISDISDKINYRSISTKAYMGGSILYNPKDLSNSQLLQGIYIATRLGKVTKNEVSKDDIIYTDIENEALYGYIYINNITEKSINFSYVEYSQNGIKNTEKSFNLEVNQNADLNGDGLADVSYSKPLTKRAGLEKTLWLTFISNQENQYTSMFSILPEQYTRGVYPAGLFGINPDGQFIVSKYENNSSTRSVVKGLSAGDFVLDNKTGTYHKVKGNTSYKNTRSIDESDLETEDSIADVNFYFTEEDFSTGYSAIELIETLPLEIINKYEPVSSELEAVVTLNKILLQENFVPLCIKNLNLEIDSEFQEILAITNTLSEYELVSFNRMFMSDTFKEVCPAIDYNCTDITDILPLVSVYINATENEEESDTNETRSVSSLSYRPIELSNTIGDTKNFKTITNFANWKDIEFSGKAGYKLATSYNEYIASTKNLENKVNSCKKIKIGFLSKKITNNKLGIGNSNAGNLTFAELDIETNLYLGGRFTISWSNCKADLSAYTMLSTYARTCLKYAYSASLIGGEQNIFNINGSFCIGPVPFVYGLRGDYDIPYSINGEVNSDYLYAGFTGLAGANVNVGADYGSRRVKWFKVWRKWIYRYSIYFEPYTKTCDALAECAFFAGIANSSEKNGLSITASVSPYFALTPYLGLGVSAGNININLPVTEQVSAGINVKTNGSIDGFFSNKFSIKFGGAFDLSLPIVGHKSKNFGKFEIYKTPQQKSTFPILTINQ